MSIIVTGKGSFGSVYIGLCGDEAVAVKVVEHKAFQRHKALQGGKALQGDTANTASSAREELEAMLGLDLDHPNIVRTLKFTTVQRAAPQVNVFPIESLRCLSN